MYLGQSSNDVTIISDIIGLIPDSALYIILNPFRNELHFFNFSLSFDKYLVVTNKCGIVGKLQ